MSQRDCPSQLQGVDGNLFLSMQEKGSDVSVTLTLGRPSVFKVVDNVFSILRIGKANKNGGASAGCVHPVLYHWLISTAYFPQWFHLAAAVSKGQ